MIDLQQKLVKNSMIFDKKTLFQRNTKLTEEMGELGEAIVLADFTEMLEETIDTLLVSVSIHLDLSDDFEVMNTLISSAVDEASSYQLESFHIEFIKLTGYVGRFAEAIQKYSGVATSAYKGKVSKEDVLAKIDTVIKQCALLMAIQSNDHTFINGIILRKNEKWLKHARKGFILADINQSVNVEKNSPILNEIREQMKSMDEVNPIFMDYEQISHRLSNIQDIDHVVHIDEQYNDKKDILVLSNVPLFVADKLCKYNSRFKIVSFVK
jgi:hypothetical protein